MKTNQITNVVGVYLFMWLLVLVAIPIIVFNSNINSSLLKSLVYVASAGGLGGVVYLVRSFYKHIFEGDFRTDVVWWYIFRPFLSVIIGVVSYLLLVGGLLSLGSVSNVNYEKAIMFYSGIAFLAGFSFTQFSNKLEELADTLFTKKKETK